jgi:hypothetical protein
MQIKSKKTGKTFIISSNDWKKLIDQKLANNYVVIDKDDKPIQRIVVPSKITEYQTEIKEGKLRIGKDAEQKKKTK